MIAFRCPAQINILGLYGDFVSCASVDCLFVPRKHQERIYLILHKILEIRNMIVNNIITADFNYNLLLILFRVVDIGIF